MKEAVTQKVVGLIAETLAVPDGKVSLDLSVGDIPQWNSMANVAIVIAIEDTFGIKIPSEDLFELTTVSAFIEEVWRLVPHG